WPEASEIVVAVKDCLAQRAIGFLPVTVAVDEGPGLAYRLRRRDSGQRLEGVVGGDDALLLVDEPGDDDGDRQMVEEVLEAFMLERLAQFGVREQVVEVVGTAGHTKSSSCCLIRRGLAPGRGAGKL